MTEPTLQERLLAWEHESPALGPVIREAAARLVELERERDALEHIAAEMTRRAGARLTAKEAAEERAIAAAARLALAEEVVKAARPYARPKGRTAVDERNEVAVTVTWDQYMALRSTIAAYDDSTEAPAVYAHLGPAALSVLTRCCGVATYDLPAHSSWWQDPALVTCPEMKRASAEGEK